MTAVKQARTPPRRKENPEYAEMVRRILAAYGRRVGSGNLEDLGPMREIIDRAEDDLAVAVAGFRSQHPPHSWAAIGAALGMTKQAAWIRFHDHPALAGGEEETA